jgi:UDP-N-acetylmuramyl pentapeptide phosphotransferase/UDP-N-acetylglucosamine-1-phosphate transferase
MDLNDFFQPILLALIKYLVIFGCTYLLTLLIFPFIRGLIAGAGFNKPNYREEQIPAVMGVIFVALLPFITGLSMLFSVNSIYDSMLFLFVVVAMGFMGLLDDQMGNRNSKGFKGHFLALFKSRQLTSGGFKAVFGAMIALVFSIAVALQLKTPWWPLELIINFLLVSLATNMVNLFDLRPGRAGKIYLVVFFIILAFSKNLENYLGLFLPVAAIILYYLPFDLRAEVMMGDVGSNVLGASLGMMMAWMLSDISKIVALVIMLILQLSAEKVSFTRMIEKNVILRYIDNIGRKKV